jgi:hypothetical protein
MLSLEPALEPRIDIIPHGRRQVMFSVKVDDQRQLILNALSLSTPIEPVNDC